MKYNIKRLFVVKIISYRRPIYYICRFSWWNNAYKEILTGNSIDPKYVMNGTH